MLQKIVLLLALLSLTACPPHGQPPCIPIPGAPCPDATPTPTGIPSIPTPTMPPTASPTPRATAIPPVQVQQLTSGRAVWRFDISAFTPRPRTGPDGEPLPPSKLLDYYAGVTACWDPADLHAPCIELSIRGYDPQPCLAQPCGSRTEGAERRPVGPHPLGLVLRESGDILHDGTGISEHEMCGQGILYPYRLPLGSWPIVDVVVEWSPAGWRVSTPAASATLKQGAPRVGLGWWAPGVGNPPKGIGWARDPWSFQSHGGSARLVSWAPVGEQPPLGSCP